MKILGILGITALVSSLSYCGLLALRWKLTKGCETKEPDLLQAQDDEEQLKFLAEYNKTHKRKKK